MRFSGPARGVSHIPCLIAKLRKVPLDDDHTRNSYAVRAGSGASGSSPTGAARSAGVAEGSPDGAAGRSGSCGIGVRRGLSVKREQLDHCVRSPLSARCVRTSRYEGIASGCAVSFSICSSDSSASSSPKSSCKQRAEISGVGHVSERGTVSGLQACRIPVQVFTLVAGCSRAVRRRHCCHRSCRCITRL